MKYVKLAVSIVLFVFIIVRFCFVIHGPIWMQCIILVLAVAQAIFAFVEIDVTIEKDKDGD